MVQYETGCQKGFYSITALVASLLARVPTRQQQASSGLAYCPAARPTTPHAAHHGQWVRVCVAPRWWGGERAGHATKASSSPGGGGGTHSVLVFWPGSETCLLHDRGHNGCKEKDAEAEADAKAATWRALDPMIGAKGWC